MLGIVLEELTSARSGDQRLSSKNKYCLSGQPGIQLPVMDVIIALMTREIGASGGAVLSPSPIHLLSIRANCPRYAGGPRDRIGNRSSTTPHRQQLRFVYQP
jgi:hypothetical protein